MRAASCTWANGSGSYFNGTKYSQQRALLLKPYIHLKLPGLVSVHFADQALRKEWALAFGSDVS